jgi:hypothetical protein
LENHQTQPVFPDHAERIFRIQFLMPHAEFKTVDKKPDAQSNVLIKDTGNQSGELHVDVLPNLSKNNSFVPPKKRQIKKPGECIARTSTPL